MDHGECVAGNPRIYGQLVTTLGKYSKFAGAGDKASVRQAVLDAALPDEAAAPSQTLSVPRAPRAVKAAASEAGDSETS